MYTEAASKQASLQCSPSKMAAGGNSNRAPCLNFPNCGPLGNAQASNSAHSSSTNNGGSMGATEGAPRAAGNANTQSGPDASGGADVAVRASPSTQNARRQSASQNAMAALAPAAAGGTPATASNMTATSAATASSVEPSASLSSVLNSTASSASVLVYREPVYNWQATKSTVKERFAFLFNNEVLSDVHFLVGKGMGVQRIPAHR